MKKKSTKDKKERKGIRLLSRTSGYALGMQNSGGCHAVVTERLQCLRHTHTYMCADTCTSLSKASPSELPDLLPLGLNGKAEG